MSFANSADWSNSSLIPYQFSVWKRVAQVFGIDAVVSLFCCLDSRSREAVSFGSGSRRQRQNRRSCLCGSYVQFIPFHLLVANLQQHRGTGLMSLFSNVQLSDKHAGIVERNRYAWKHGIPMTRTIWNRCGSWFPFLYVMHTSNFIAVSPVLLFSWDKQCSKTGSASNKHLSKLIHSFTFKED